jgi:hypothetical protein
VTSSSRDGTFDALSLPPQLASKMPMMPQIAILVVLIGTSPSIGSCCVRAVDRIVQSGGWSAVV